MAKVGSFLVLPWRPFALVIMAALPAFSVDLVGAAECGKCHIAEFQKQRHSRHAASLRPILESPLKDKLVGHTVNEDNGLKFDYHAAPGGIAVTVNRAGRQRTALLEWAFGAGAQGITPVGTLDGAFFEHRVSWYPREARAALTIGQESQPPSSLEDALGRKQPPDLMLRCFQCHATGVTNGRNPSGMRAGIECERCHGPGADHSRNPATAAMNNPGKLPPAGLLALCGECHRLPASGAAPAEAELNKPENVRFAPIGLMASRCYRVSGKLSCITCHDPHEDARTDPRFYSAKCSVCHETAAQVRKSECPRAAGVNCLPCHMPRSGALPMLEFTDHRIRVIRAAQPPAAASWTRVEQSIDAADFEQARRLLEQLPHATPKWHLLASRIYDALNDPAHAVSEAETAIDLDPNNLAAFLQLGEIFLSHNTPQPALEIFTEARRIDPGSLLARLGRGLALKQLQLSNEAEKDLSACLQANPRLAVAFDALADLYLTAADDGKLDHISERFVRTNPSDYRGYYYLAAAKVHTDAAQAEKLLRHSLALNPNFAASSALLGKLLIEHNRLGEAVAALERAVRLRPDYRPAHFHLGNAYRKLGRIQDSDREFQIVRELNEKDASIPSLTYHRRPPRN